MEFPPPICLAKIKYHCHLPQPDEYYYQTAARHSLPTPDESYTPTATKPSNDYYPPSAAPHPHCNRLSKLNTTTPPSEPFESFPNPPRRSSNAPLFDFGEAKTFSKLTFTVLFSSDTTSKTLSS
ncbi:hypothetical protein MtrunA17_Chr6g0465101 [Medicago truncatula]|uniref:Uncharacterized protein n=1 Tax=Medicago truncatula TaxID=3880 RepID=A0A396HH34_MEDTR|nr:hypothetical protein MtrunA17_Chr6g0465101 [Medicago truncatula]